MTELQSQQLINILGEENAALLVIESNRMIAKLFVNVVMPLVKELNVNPDTIKPIWIREVAFKIVLQHISFDAGKKVLRILINENCIKGETHV